MVLEAQVDLKKQKSPSDCFMVVSYLNCTTLFWLRTKAPKILLSIGRFFVSSESSERKLQFHDFGVASVVVC